MAIYEVKGGKYEVPDDIKGQALVDVLTQLNQSIPEVEPSKFQGLAEEQGALGALAISTGKGMRDIPRGLGLDEKATGVEKESYQALSEEYPVSTFVGETVGQTAPFLLPGVGVGAIPSTMGRVAGSTLLGGIEGGAIANAEDQSFLEGAGIGSAISGTAEVFFPVLGRVVRQTFNKLTGRTPNGALVDAQGNPTQEMKRALDSAGLTWEDMKESAKNMIGMQPEGASAEQVARMAGFEDIGAPYSKGQITKDFAQRKQESSLLESTEPAADPFRSSMLEQSDQFRSELIDIADIEKRTDPGEEIKTALSSRKKKLRKEKNNAYSQLSQETEYLKDAPVFTEGLMVALPDARTQRRISKLSPSQYDSLQDLLVEYGVNKDPELVKSAVDAGIEIEELGLKNFEDFRADLNRISKSDITGTISMMTDPLKKAVDDEVDLATTAIEGVGGEIGELAKEARKANILYKTEFDEAKVTSKLIDSVKRGSTQPKIEASKAYNKIMTKGAPIEDLERVLKSLKAEGPLGKKAIKEMQGKAVMDLLDSAFSAQSRQIQGNRVFGATPYSKQFEALKPKLDLLFANNKGDLKRLENVYNRAQDIIPPSGAVPKGSAGFFMDALNKIGVYSVMTKVPFARELMEIARSASEKVESRKFLDKALNAKPDVKKLAWSIDRDYPQMATALGIAGISTEEE